MTTPRRMVIIIDGYNDAHTAKTAICLIRYRPEEVVAVLDRQSAGKTCQEVFGVGGPIPCIGALADNGGPTQPHALLPGSPAIDMGSLRLHRI